MPFILDEYSSKGEKCLISLEAYGCIDGEMMYCYSSFSLKSAQMYENGDFEEMLNLLRAPGNRTVSVKLKYSKGVVKDFRLMLDSLAESYDDQRFLQLELVAWGLDSKSCRGI